MDSQLVSRYKIFQRDSFACTNCSTSFPFVVLVAINEKTATKETAENYKTICIYCYRKTYYNDFYDSRALQEVKRQQLEQFILYKKLQPDYEIEIEETLFRYINEKIKPLYIEEPGKDIIRQWIEKFEINEIFLAIDIGAKSYIKRYDGEILKKSAELFFEKVPGIIKVRKLPPVEQKLAFIKGIARNRYSFDETVGSSILKSYVSELEKHYSEEQILDDLENVVSPMTKDSKHWNQWLKQMEKWIEDIQTWEKKATKVESSYELQPHEILEQHVEETIMLIEDKVNALLHIAAPFPKFDAKKFKVKLDKLMLKFLMECNDLTDMVIEKDDIDITVDVFIYKSGLGKFFDFDVFEVIGNAGLLSVLDEIARDLLDQIFHDLYYPVKDFKREQLEEMILYHIQEINLKIKSRSRKK